MRISDWSSDVCSSDLDEQRHSCGPVWEFADWIHYRFTRLDGAMPFPGSSSSVSPTVVLYPPSTAYVPDASDGRIGFRRDFCRSFVIFLPGQQLTYHACPLVLQSHRVEHARLPRQHPPHPT